MTIETDFSSDFARLIEDARLISSDLGETVHEILRIGTEQPLSKETATQLLRQLVEEITRQARARGDESSVAVFGAQVNEFVERVIAARASSPALTTGPKRLALQTHEGIQPVAVRPSPVFHQREVPVVQGFVRTRDIRLWDGNERLDIHLNQFKSKFGRPPSADELLDMMQGRMSLPGSSNDDHFAIQDLAQSIAVNGVRKPPIVDLDGTLLDGNRRVAACHLILASEDFNPSEKARAEWLQVWQLTEHATDADRDAVIVSLNFEPDNKQDWPEYVKASKVYQDWQALLAVEPSPTVARVRKLKSDLSKKFALGPDASQVTRYIHMVELSNEFEDYHVGDRARDQFEVKHKSERYFQYFDELGKGRGPGGVHYSLNQDEPFKHLVFDLLFEGKFSNWNKIRDLKWVANNEDALSYLRQARDERDVERAQELVDDGCSAARTARATERAVASNKRIEVFVDWLEGAPVKIFAPGDPNSIRPENIARLYRALKLVEGYVTPTEANA